jgi:hypothetical protein
VQPEHLDKADMAKLAVLVRRFNIAWDAQLKRDSEALSGLVRALRRGGTEVDQFRQLLFQQEDSSKNAVSRNHRERAARST